MAFILELCAGVIAEDYIIGGSEAEPHEFPWVVRIAGGCAGTGDAKKNLCGGSLISPRLILFAFHCTVSKDDKSKPCDHTDEKRVAVLGLHKFKIEDFNTYYTIPIIEVKYPDHGDQGFRRNYASHDFAMMVLKEPAKFSSTIKPICLPVQGRDFCGETAIAAGWGGTKPGSNEQSPVLKKVELTVSPTLKYSKMLRTVLRKENDEYQDPCNGDSGGPLMLKDHRMSAYILIGTVQGGGYSCPRDTVSSLVGKKDGVWNKVSYWVDW